MKGQLLGTHKIIAVALDNYAIFSDPLALEFDVL
jgi:hypothetical protein